MSALDLDDDAPRRTALWIVLPIAVAMALLIVLLATREPGSERAASSAVVGELAPLIEGETVDGRWFDIDSLRGQWVVVNFFSTTCIPCIQEHPELVAFSESHAATADASVVSVAFDDSRANIEEFFAQYGGSWPVIAGDTGSVAVAYGVTAVPESYLVAPSGIVAAKVLGGVSELELDAMIVRLTQESEAAGT